MEELKSAFAMLSRAGRLAAVVMSMLAIVINNVATASTTAWSGRYELPDDWSGHFTISAKAFAEAEAGYVVRVEYCDWHTKPMLSFCNKSWKALDGFGAYVADHCSDEFALTASALAELQSGGMLVTGRDVTVTSIKIYKPAELIDLSPRVEVTDNWTFTDGHVAISLTADNPTAETLIEEAKVLVMTDQYRVVDTYRADITIASRSTATATVEFDAAPGIYRCVAMVGRQPARTFCIAVEPEQIISAPDMQSDFEAFWSAAKAELATVEPEYTLTELTDKTTLSRRIYLIEMKSVADSTGVPATIRAYYAEPVGESTYPAIIHYPGYDGGTGTPFCPSGDDLIGYAELYCFVRGQGLNNRAPYENTYGEWRTYGLGSEDTYYYRQAYLDAVRFVDFMASRSCVDRRNIFVTGASQGGALSVAAAALDDRINAAAVACTAMGDFPDYFKIQSWPGSVYRAAAAEIGLEDSEMMEILSYFDTKNLATMVGCPLMLNFSLQDTTCPPHTNLASYNNLPSSVEKSYTVNAELGHTTPGDWDDTVLQFFNAHLRGDYDTSLLGKARYNLLGQRVSDSYKGVVVVKGKTFINR
jgi:cephalosporin-C deacetylase